MSTLLGHMGLVTDFLILTLMSPPGSAFVVEGTSIVVPSCLTHIRRIVATGIETLADLSAYEAAYDEVVVIVCVDYNHAKELLLYNNTRTTTLMNRRMLVVHKVGMMCSLQSKRDYGVAWCDKVDNEALDRQQVIARCADVNTMYYQMLTDAHIHDCKPMHILYHAVSEPLVTFGVEYVFCMFRTSHELSKRVDKLIYIVKSKDVVNAATVL